jgi:putative NIF3 family GTP cyclohydrolase 1 type 2
VEEKDREKKGGGTTPLSFTFEMGFRILANGPPIPRDMVIISGGSAKDYERAIEAGADTYFSGEMKEPVPALSFESQTNFVDLGHYDSEKPGILALQKHLEEKFSLQTVFIDIPNRL